MMGEDLCARIASALEAAKAEMEGASDADTYYAMAVRAMAEARGWLATPQAAQHNEPPPARSRPAQSAAAAGAVPYRR
jgi:hypothetical protein